MSDSPSEEIVVVREKNNKMLTWLVVVLLIVILIVAVAGAVMSRKKTKVYTVDNLGMQSPAFNLARPTYAAPLPSTAPTPLQGGLTHSVLNSSQAPMSFVSY